MAALVVRLHPRILGIPLTERDWLSVLEPAALEALAWDILSIWVSDWPRRREVWRSPHFDIVRLANLQPDGRFDGVEGSHAVLRERLPGAVSIPLPPVQMGRTCLSGAAFPSSSVAGANDRDAPSSLVIRDA